MKGHFDKAGVTPRRHTVELRTADASEYTLGQELTVELFEPGQVVDVVGTSKGKGFAGVVKRHGFAGLRASTVSSASTAHRVPSARAPPPGGSFVASGCPAGWAGSE